MMRQRFDWQSWRAPSRATDIPLRGRIGTGRGHLQIPFLRATVDPQLNGRGNRKVAAVGATIVRAGNWPCVAPPSRRPLSPCRCANMVFP